MGTLLTARGIRIHLLKSADSWGGEKPRKVRTGRSGPDKIRRSDPLSAVRNRWRDWPKNTVSIYEREIPESNRRDTYLEGS